jgi:hypothetical protein
VAVELGVGAEAAATQNAAYLTHRRLGRPRVTLKAAASLDGKVAAPDGSSQWITGPAARADAHRLRAEADAVMVGAGTALADDPRLTVRLPGWAGRQPRGAESTPPGGSGPAATVRHRAETLVAPPSRRPPHVDAWRPPGPGRRLPDGRGSGVVRVDLGDLARVLGAGVLGCWSRAAPGCRQPWAAGLADRLVWYLAPLAIGGRGPGCWAATAPRPWPMPAGCAWPRPTASATTCGSWRSHAPRRKADIHGIVEGTGTVAALAVAADGGGGSWVRPWLAGDLRLERVGGGQRLLCDRGPPAAAGFRGRPGRGTRAAPPWRPGHGPGLERPAWPGRPPRRPPGQGHVDRVARIIDRPREVWAGGQGRLRCPTWNGTWSRRGRSRSTGSADRGRGRAAGSRSPWCRTPGGDHPRRPPPGRTGAAGGGRGARYVETAGGPVRAGRAGTSRTEDAPVTAFASVEDAVAPGRRRQVVVVDDRAERGRPDPDRRRPPRRWASSSATPPG